MESEALIYRPRPSEGTRQRRVFGDIPQVAKSQLDISSNSSISRNVLRTFDPTFEMDRALEVNSASSEEYEKRREQFLSYEMMQMETHLGERFNVNISRFEYDIKDGQMYGKDMNEPFMDSIKRGRDIRRKIGNSIDFAREDAEVEGFSKIQSVLLDPETPIGTMMLSISPKGGEKSTYQHNFYDIFTLREKNGVRYVETRRYTSGLKISEYKEMLSPFIDFDIDDEDPAASLLANPIAIQNTFSPDDLHRYLHRDHKSMDERVFKIVKKHCAEIAKEFALSLIDEPENFQKHKELFDTYLNKADDIAEKIEREGMNVWEKIVPIRTPYMVREDVNVYGRAPVREVMTGCGASGGFEKTNKNNSPFSVSEFGKNWSYHKGDCVSCKTRYTQVGPCNICKDCEKKFDEEST